MSIMMPIHIMPKPSITKLNLEMSSAPAEIPVEVEIAQIHKVNDPVKSYVLMDWV